MRFNVAISTLIIIVAGCKPPAGSQVQSLENFSAGALLRQNVCFGDRETIEPRDMLDFPVSVNSGSDSQNETLNTVARSALSAIPYDMKALVVMAGGKILVTKDAAKLCGRDRLRSGSDSGDFSKFASCFVDMPKGNRDASGLSIVISDNAAYVNHILVRTFAYALSQKFAWEFMAAKSDGSLTDVNPFEYDDLRDEVVAAYLQDMATSKVFDLKKLERLLGQDAEQIIAKNRQLLNARDLDKLFKKLTWSNEKGMQLTRSLAPTIGDSFKDFVVGEAFDSYHCAAFGDYSKQTADEIQRTGNLALFAKLKNTRKVMAEFFPRTYKAYKKMDRHFLRLGRAARNSLAASVGGRTLGPVEDSAEARSSARGSQGLSLQGEETTQSQRDKWDAAARRSPSYAAAQQRIADLQQKKSEAWVAGGYRYDERIQQAQFDAQKIWRAEFNRAQAQETKQPVVDHYKPQEFVTQREAFNQGLDEHLAKTQKAVNDKFAEASVAGQQFKEELITYSKNTNSPMMAALAAGSGELIGGVGDLSTQISQGVNNGLHATAKGLVSGAQTSYDTAQGTSEFIHDASIIYRETGGDALDKAAAVSQATQGLIGKKVVAGTDAAIAEWDRMKTEYNSASEKISAQAVESTNNGSNPYLASLDAVGRNVSAVGRILPSPLSGVAPVEMLENTYVGGEALVQGMRDGDLEAYGRSRAAFGKNVADAASDALIDSTLDKANEVTLGRLQNFAYDGFTSKSGPFADQRRDLTAGVINAQRAWDRGFENAIVGGAPKGSTEQWLRQGAFDNGKYIMDKMPDLPSAGGLLESYRQDQNPNFSDQPATFQPSAPSQEPSPQTPDAYDKPTDASSAPAEPTFE